MKRVLQCPRCKWHVVQRAPRDGTFERLISLVSVYPFRCQVCMHRFRAWRRGVRYTRQRDDRREYTRTDVRLPAVVWFHGWRATGALRDISVTGGSIETDLRAPVDSLIQLDIELPDGQVVAVDGAQVRSLREGSLGLQFTWIRTPERARLQAYLIDVLGLSASAPAPVPRPPSVLARLRPRAIHFVLLAVLAVFWALLWAFGTAPRCLWHHGC